MQPDPQQTRHTQKRYNATSVIYNIMEWPIEQWWYKQWREQLWERVDGPEVLEIGVGTGKNIPYYPENVQVTGIDLSPGMLNHAQKLLSEKKTENATLREMDAQKMGFPDNRFDEVVATFAFCSVPDPVLGLKEALRVAKPGGKLYLLEHMLSRKAFISPIMKAFDPVIHYVMGVHIARETVQNVEAAGWEIQQVQDLAASGIFRMIEAKKSVS